MILLLLMPKKVYRRGVQVGWLEKEHWVKYGSVYLLDLEGGSHSRETSLDQQSGLQYLKGNMNMKSFQKV